jgi:outer membrane lipoprotein carrier protein
MRKLFPIFFTWISCMTMVSGQNDQKAVNILDKFSSTATSAPSVSMKFMIITDDEAESTKDTLNGSVIICRNSYRLNLPDNIIWYNGETSWSYLTTEKEVTITRPDKKDDSFQSKPSSIFTMYKKGYKNRLVEEKPGFYLIDLYPVDIKSDLIRVRLNLSRPSLTLNSFEYKRKDGVTITLLVKEYNLKQIPETDTFIFSTEKHKGIEIIDMR